MFKDFCFWFLPVFSGILSTYSDCTHVGVLSLTSVTDTVTVPVPYKIESIISWNCRKINAPSSYFSPFRSLCNMYKKNSFQSSFCFFRKSHVSDVVQLTFKPPPSSAIRVIS